MPHWLKWTILAILFLLAASWPLARQLADGGIEGQITDGQRPIIGASVEARNIMTGAIAHASSDSEGLYRLQRLRPGRYSLWVTARDYCSLLVVRVVVEAGATTRRDIQLVRPESISTCAPSSASRSE